MTYEPVEIKGAPGYDSVSGWEELPEGVTESGGGFLITAKKTAGEEQRLELTSKAADSAKPGETGDSGSAGEDGGSRRLWRRRSYGQRRF